MIKRLTLFLIVCGVIFVLCDRASAQEESLTFGKDDRVLVLAPHPDDEAIATGGVIQRARAAGANVKIVCFTNGDNNELSFIVYEKRLTLRKREFLHMGEVRARETLQAMEFLGLSSSDIIFLGYPDFGTMRILVEYWGHVKPYESWLTRVNKVVYPEAMSVGAPYVGESILADLKKILLTFNPTKIFVSHPADVNRDHRALYVYLQVALLDLEGKLAPPQVYPYLVHAVQWPMPRGFQPDLDFQPPKNFEESGISWNYLTLTKEEIDKKHETIKYYKSQIPYAPTYLVSFARRDEFFGDFPVLKLKEQDPQEALAWQNLKSPTDLDEDEEDQGQGDGLEKNHLISTVEYALSDRTLWVKMSLKKNIEKNLGVTLFIFGYNKNKDFGLMPKIQVPINLLGIHLKDKKKMLFVKKIKYKLEGNVWTLGLPLSLLGNPDHIFSYARAHSGTLPIETTAWRVLEL